MKKILFAVIVLLIVSSLVYAGSNRRRSGLDAGLISSGVQAGSSLVKSNMADNYSSMVMQQRQQQHQQEMYERQLQHEKEIYRRQDRVYVVDGGQYYHTVSCPHIKGYRLIPTTRGIALERGYRYCNTCKP